MLFCKTVNFISLILNVAKRQYSGAVWHSWRRAGHVSPTHLWHPGHPDQVVVMVVMVMVMVMVMVQRDALSNEWKKTYQTQACVWVHSRCLERHLSRHCHQVLDSPFNDCFLLHLLPDQNNPSLRERGFLGGQIFKENMVLCPSRVLFLIACFLILVWRRKKSNKRAENHINIS